MRVLLTGATGFLGSRLLARLLARDVQVSAVVRADGRESGRQRLLRQLAGADPGPNLRIVEGDVTRSSLGLPPAELGRLAAEVDAVWHCAGLVTLQEDPAILRRTNITGTANVLGLAGRAGVPVVHVSTAFVAGNRDGVVREDELLTGHGFVTPYEASKHQAERLVHDWAQRTGGRVTIYRPSVLVTDGPNRPPAAPHPIQRIGLLVSQLLNAVGPGSWPLTLRLPAALLGWLNLIQVEDAADLMVEDGLTGAASPEETARDTGGTAPDSGTAGPPVRTRHVVHQRETPFREVVTAFEQSLPVRWVLVAEPPAEPTPLEQFAEQQLSSFLPYARQSRHFAPGALAGARRLTPIDSAYVARSLRAAGIGADRAAGGPAACGPPAFRTAAAHGQ